MTPESYRDSNLLRSAEAWLEEFDDLPAADVQRARRAAAFLSEWNCPPVWAAAPLVIPLVRHGKADRARIGTRLAADTAALLTRWMDLETAEVTRPRVRDSTEHQPEYDVLCKLFMASYQDEAVAFIGMALLLAEVEGLPDRLSEAAGSAARRLQITLLPLLERYGLWHLLRETSEKLFTLRHSRDAQTLRRQIMDAERKNRDIEEHVRYRLASSLHGNGIDFEMTRRPMRISQVDRQARILGQTDMDKSEAQWRAELAERTRLQIQVESVESCYVTMGYIHARWKPIEGSFKDYLSKPKSNGYVMLRTAVEIQLPDDRAVHAVEFYICTRDQQRTNLWGRVAEWQAGADSPRRLIPFAWWHDCAREKKIVAANVPGALSSPTYVFSPTGQLYELDQYSTPVDFAYAVHSDLGRFYQSARVNGVPAQSHFRLANFDIVDVQIDPYFQSRPLDQWLTTVRSQISFRRLRRHFRHLSQREARGKSTFEAVYERNSARLGLKLSETRLQMYLNSAAQFLKYDNVNALFREIAGGRASPDTIVNRILSQEVAHRVIYANGEPLGLEPDQIHLAQCCNPAIGTDIHGLRRSSGTRRLTIHDAACPNIRDRNDKVHLSWRPEQSDTLYEYALLGTDRHAILLDVLLPFYDHAYLYEVHAKRLPDGNAQISLIAQHQSPASEREIASNLEQITELFEHEKHPLGMSAEELRREPSISGLFPYNLPVFHKGDFVGRKRETEKVKRFLLSADRSLIVHGPWRIGKTSLLRFVQQYDVEEFKAIAVYTNCHTLTEWRFDALLKMLAADVSQRMEEKSKEIGRRDLIMSPAERRQLEIDPVDTFYKYMARLSLDLADTGYQLVIMLDEFSDFYDETEIGVVDHLVFSKLRTLLESDLDHKFIFVIQAAALHKMRQSRRSGAGLLAISRTLSLPLPSAREFRGLLQRRANMINLSCTPEAIQQVLDLTGCNPYLLNLICQESAEAAGRDGIERLTFQHVNDAVRSVVSHNQNGALYLRQLARLYSTTPFEAEAMQYASSHDAPVAEEEIVDHICNATRTNSTKKALNTLELLVEKGGLIRDGTGTNGSESVTYRLPFPLLADWIRRNPVAAETL